MAADRGFHTFDHTADIGLASWGPDFAAALAEAAMGLQSLIVSEGEIRDRRRRTFAVTAGDPAALVVVWLNELIFAFDVDQLVFARFEVHTTSDRSLEALAVGEPFDSDRHRLGTGIKAATYHELNVRLGDDRAELRVILDL